MLGISSTAMWKPGATGFLSLAIAVRALKCHCVIVTCQQETRDAVTGKLTFKGNALKHTKGVPYLVDCAITGSDVGTATKPCFPLRKLWEYTLIPAIAQLVDTGGPCEDAIVVVQQDNAGPHIEANYSQWIRDQCDLLGWLYEPKRPKVCTIRNLAYMHVIGTAA